MSMISNDRKQQILELLQKIEQTGNVKIIHAVESGSRAWGFPSIDSDYDVRFIYHHQRDWYITAFSKKDNIDIAITDDLDAGGWDISKCMRLLHNGNAVLQEWLNSPIVYRTDEAKHAKLKQLAAQVFNPAAAFYHYLSLAKKKFADEKTRVNAKYFLYGFRSLLCARWIADENSVPPVLFDVLVQKYLVSEEKVQLQDILQIKAQGGEQDHYTIPELIWRRSNDFLNSLSAIKVEGKKQGNYEPFDAVLRVLIV